jgi:hypothetical protein
VATTGAVGLERITEGARGMLVSLSEPGMPGGFMLGSSNSASDRPAFFST